MLEEFAALKKIVLSENERYLFDYGIKPILEISKREEIRRLTILRPNYFEESLKNFIQKFENKTNNQIGNNILIHLLDS